MSDQSPPTERREEPGDRAPQGGLTGARIAGVVLVLFGLLVLYQTVGIIAEGGLAPDSPGVFPLVVSVGLVAFGGIFLFNTFFRPDPALLETVAVEGEKSDWRKFGLILAALIVYVLLLAPLGYILATTLFFVATAWAMGSRRYIRDTIIGVLFSAVIYFGFTELLNVRLPPGIFPGGLL